MLMMLARLGSLNALEQQEGSAFWSRWLGRPMPSADTVGRVFETIDLEAIRSCIHHVYTRLKRNKALGEFGGVYALVIDGHESFSSYLQSCQGCLKRRVRAGDGERTQFYHRNVSAVLVTRDFTVLLDVEEQRKGEDEVACATRLCRRVLMNYPRAFQVVLADALFLRSDFFKFLLDHGKDVICVLKDERRDLMEDARSLFKSEPPILIDDGNVKREVWDIEGFTSWESLGRPVRVVRSLETRRVTRQLTGEEEAETSEWMWVTTLPQWKVGTKEIVGLGHARWLIENQAFNEMVTYWHANHMYRHHPAAITAFWLTLMLVMNLFRAFINLNIKPELRAGHTQLHFARLLSAELYGDGDSEKPP
ncbi:MAG: transposase [Actinobacteria bacterium]|nr:transposase [Actinomycetota bacterium]MBU4358777.1 transposase [Actinomycetota bacterium]